MDISQITMLERVGGNYEPYIRGHIFIPPLDQYIDVSGEDVVLHYGINKEFGTVSFGFWHNDPKARPIHGGFWHGSCEAVSKALKMPIVQVVINNRSCGMLAETLKGILPKGFQIARAPRTQHKWVVRKVQNERNT